MSTEGAGWWNDIWAGGLSRQADGPEAPTWTNEIDTRKIAFLEGKGPSAGEALEVGCGSARLLCRVGRTRPGLRLVALDNADAAIAQAHATAAVFGVAVDGVLGNALSHPFDSNRFDMVLSGGLLEHFDEPRAVLSEMVRVIKPGGLFYADVVPRKVSWYRMGEMSRMLRSPWLAPGVLESSFLAPEYVRWLEELGCEQVEVVSCGVYPSTVARLPGALRRAAAGAFGMLDGTLLADLTGWYFMLSAVKRAA